MIIPGLLTQFFTVSENLFPVVASRYCQEAILSTHRFIITPIMKNIMFSGDGGCCQTTHRPVGRALPPKTPDSLGPETRPAAAFCLSHLFV
jgi:hypothetical protein